MVRLVIITNFKSAFFFFFESNVLYYVSAIWSESEGDYSQSLEKIRGTQRQFSEKYLFGRQFEI